MRRTILLTLLLALFALALGAFAGESMELEGLHLVAWEDVPGGTPAFTGPVGAAILMAWHAEHGYPRLLSDHNGNGRVDEPDTIELSRSFAVSMRAQADPVCDPRLVDAVARYVAEKYPDSFEIWIYDPSFPDEYRQHMGRPFEPADYPGIGFRLLGEPSRQDYVEHMEQDRPGIVGIGFEADPNVFAVSRSAQLSGEPEGWPVGLANTSHAAFGPDRIWNTLLREEPEHWVFDVREWIPFETFVVLVPVREAGPREPDAPGEPEYPGDEPGGEPGDPGDEPGGEPGDPGDEPGGEPGDPGDEPGGEPGDPGDEPGDPGDPPSPTLLPNLWVTDMDGCWSISSDAREHVIALVSGVVHNGGQATATNVEVLVMANGVSATLTIAIFPAGTTAFVIFRELDLGPYDTMSWPIQTSITADPYNQITEADETNNSTNSAIPKSSTCD